MWSYAIEWLDDVGHVIKYAVVSAFNARHAELQAMNDSPLEYSTLEVTRL